MAADALIDDLLAALGERGVLTSPTDRARFETGWRYGKGAARCVARPASTDSLISTFSACPKKNDS